jgi:hypothetical protein
MASGKAVLLFRLFDAFRVGGEMKNSLKVRDSCIDLVVEVRPVHPTHEEHANRNGFNRRFCWRWQDLKALLRITRVITILLVVMTACLTQLKEKRNDWTARTLRPSVTSSHPESEDPKYLVLAPLNRIIVG